MVLWDSSKKPPAREERRQTGSPGGNDQAADGPSLPGLDCAPPKSLTLLFHTNLNRLGRTMQLQSKARLKFKVCELAMFQTLEMAAKA